MSRATETKSSGYGLVSHIQREADKAIQPQTRPVQRIEQCQTQDQPASTKPNRSVFATIDAWFVREMLGMAISAGVFVALVVVLLEYDQKPQPNWGYMTLNSLISWLSTLARICVIIACSETLGQLKWVWFSQKPRPIHELRTFDLASRGTFGALELIWTLRARHFAALASLALVLSLAMDPFTQNLVHYYTNLVEDPSQQALIGNAPVYSVTGAQVTSAFSMVDPVLKSNVYNSLFNTDPEKPWSIPQYSCPSANCTWPPAVALEVRALCANITDQLTYSCYELGESDQPPAGTNCTVLLPSSNLAASYVRYEDALLWMRGFIVQTVVNSSQAVVYKNYSITTIQYIAPRLSGGWWGDNPPSGDTTWEATECTIEPIVRSFRAAVHNNIYSEQTIDVWNTYTESTDPQLAGYEFQPSWGPELGMSAANQTFTYGLAANVALNRFLDINFGGYFWRSPRDQAFNPEGISLYAAPDVLQALGFGEILGCSDQLATRLYCTMHNVAQAISKTFRDSRYSLDPGDDGAEVAVGVVRATATYVSVQWQWFALPVIVWVVTAVALVGTLWKVKRGRVPRWKNDPVPLLFLYSEEERGHRQSSGISLHGNPEFDHLKVRLHERSGRVVLHQE